MSERDIDNGGPAHPVTAGHQVYSTGMNLRDWFAGQALSGITAGYWSNPDMSGVGPHGIANEAYEYADAMLAARKCGAA